jgi:hypothetical protein
LTGSPAVVRRGSQLPRLEHYPLYTTSAADDAIDIAEVVGLNLDEWQQHVLRHSLGERPDGRWTSFRNVVVVPRQNGKNALLEARELAGLFLFGEKTIVHTAHQFKTAREAMLSLMNRIKASELMGEIKGFEGDLDRDIAGMTVGNNPAITLKNGNRIVYAARSGGSGRGFTGDLIVLDEAYALTLAEMGALLPTMAARSIHGNPQVWFTSSAGKPESDLLASLRKQGMEKTASRLAYFEWSTSEERDPLDREGWYEANPGLGIRISEEYIEDEYETLAKETGSDEEFKRERLGQWAKLDADALIDQKVWRDRVGDKLENEFLDEDGAPKLGEHRVAFAVDIPPSRDSATICMAGDLGDGRTSVVVIDRRPGTDWVAERLGQLRQTWNPVAIVIDAIASSGSLLPELRRHRVRSLQVSYQHYGHACAQMFDAINQGTMTHSDQEELNNAVRVARKTPINDSLWKWNRKDKAVDLAPLVAATLARYGLESTRRREAGSRGGKVSIIA